MCGMIKVCEKKMQTRKERKVAECVHAYVMHTERERGSWISEAECTLDKLSSLRYSK